MSDPKPITVAQIWRIVKEVTRLSDPCRPYFSREHEARLISELIPGKDSRYDLTVDEASHVIDELRNRPTEYRLRVAEFGTPPDFRGAR